MFGSKTRFALLEANLEIKRLEDKLEAKEEARLDLLEENQTVRREAQMERDRHLETQGHVTELDKKNAVLHERLDLLANHLPTGGPQAFAWPEEAEDAEFSLARGEIDTQEYEAILTSVGALNTEVAFDGSDYPRLGKR